MNADRRARSLTTGEINGWRKVAMPDC